SFAFVGFLVMSLLRLAVGGKPIPWNDLRDMGKSFGTVLQGFLQAFVQVMVLPVRAVRAVGTGIKRVTWAGLRTTWFTARVGIELFLMAVTGGVVGGIVGVVVGAIHHNVRAAMPVNAAIGAGIAVVAGLVMMILDRRKKAPPMDVIDVHPV